MLQSLCHITYIIYVLSMCRILDMQQRCPSSYYCWLHIAFIQMRVGDKRD